jgi:hypothetical protein
MEFEKRRRTMMTAENDKAPDTRDKNQQPRTRGGAAEDDVSKGLGNEQSGGPFDAPEKDADEPEDKA